MTCQQKVCHGVLNRLTKCIPQYVNYFFHMLPIHATSEWHTVMESEIDVYMQEANDILLTKCL